MLTDFIIITTTTGNETSLIKDANPFRYSSYQYDKIDSDKGLYYLKTRYYDPKLGRFLTRDAVTSINMYAYVGNNPVMNVDPSGLGFETLLDVASLAQSAYEMYKNPSLTNGLFLAWDVVSLLPLVPGSYVAKGVKYLGNVDEYAGVCRIVPAGFMDDIGGAIGKKVLKLSSKNVKHIGKHIPSQFANQVKYLSKEALEKKLKKNTFFNPNWSREQIVSAVEEGYNALSKQGLTGLHPYKVNGETIKIFIKSDGTFDTAYGLHKLTSEFFGY